MQWITVDKHVYAGRDQAEHVWLPLTSLEASTPEPEQVISKPEKLMLENLLETNAKRCKQIEQLEKELAELKEKVRWKSCDNEIPEEAKRVRFKNGQRNLSNRGYYYAKQWHLIGDRGSVVKIDDDEICYWTWKYEADL